MEVNWAVFAWRQQKSISNEIAIVENNTHYMEMEPQFTIILLLDSELWSK